MLCISRLSTVSVSRLSLEGPGQKDTDGRRQRFLGRVQLGKSGQFPRGILIFQWSPGLGGGSGLHVIFRDSGSV